MSSEPRDPRRQPPEARWPRGEELACGFVLVGGLAALSVWAAGGLSSLVSGHGFRTVGLSSSLGLLVAVLVHPSEPWRAWPPSLRRLLGPAPLLPVVLVVTAATPFVALVWHRYRALRRSEAPSASWGKARELRRLAVRSPEPGRLVIGRSSSGLLATEAGHSLLVLGPTQSGKTSGLAIPALLEWNGPVLATSVKADLLVASARRRAALGRVLVFDPLRLTRIGSSWSPLYSASDWAGARRVANGLCSVARTGSSGLEDASFWYATAEKLLAPLLFAAAAGEATMADVVRWVDSGEKDEVLRLLRMAGNPEALRAASASFAREERQLSSVYATTETVLAPFADPYVLDATARHEIDPDLFLDGGANSLFVLAPAHHQERLAAVFVALVNDVLERAFENATRGGPLEPGLLVVLDEAANIAPLSNLDTLASTAASHGIELVTVFQDVAQIEARYGQRAQTVVNNHRAKVILSGVADPATLELMSALIGEQVTPVGSTTIGEGQHHSTTWSVERHRLAPSDWLRRLSPGEGVLLYGHLPPGRIRLRPYFSDRRLAALARGKVTRMRRSAPESSGRTRRRADPKD